MAVLTKNLRIPNASPTRLLYNHHPEENPVLLLLNSCLHLTGYETYEVTRFARLFKQRPMAFIEQMISGAVKPVHNLYQAILLAMYPETDVIHLYVGAVRGDVPTHYMVLIKNADGLFIPRHRKIRKVPEKLARDGVVFSYGRLTPLPEYAAERTPGITRVYTGGKGSRALIEEIASETVGFETRRQLSFAALTTSLHGSLHRNRVTVYMNPGAITLEVGLTQGDGYTTPFGFTPLAVRDYTPTPTQKPRVVIHGTANSMGLFVKPNVRCILPQVKNAPEYKPDRKTSAGVYLNFALQSAVVPFIGIEDPDGGISLIGTVYDPEADRVRLAVFATGRSERSCAGLPVLRIADRHAAKLRWLPNHSLAEILASAIWDSSPDAEAVRLRWLGVSGLFRGFGVNSPEEYARFYEELGMPLPAGSEEHIAARKQNQENYNDAVERARTND